MQNVVLKLDKYAITITSLIKKIKYLFQKS